MSRDESDRSPDISAAPEKSGSFHELFARRLSRRSFLARAVTKVPLVLVAPGLVSCALARPVRHPDTLNFVPIHLGRHDAVVVPTGYAHQVVLRWGDPLFLKTPALAIGEQSRSHQERQFGYNCDFVAYLGLPNPRSADSRHGLLVVNHEFTIPVLMFPGYAPDNPTREQVDVQLAAHGMSIVEIAQDRNSSWRPMVPSRFTRRLTGESDVLITGPAAGHEWLKVSYDSTGTLVRGTLGNCAGGRTPWGTVLSCEENFNFYFANLGHMPADDARARVHQRYGLPLEASERGWERYHDRFDVAREPNEPFRFGWVVEVDPYDPTSTPRKRTALGRFKHEAATVVVAPDKRAVVYSGDDERFEYLYKFVTRDHVRARPSENADLLDSGTLYVARFHDDGSGAWLPLISGQGPLTAWSQAEILINTRGAADLVGATKMDRPEDIETNPVTGAVYCVMTNNTARGTLGHPAADVANPRPVNRHGHIIELREDGKDPTATTFTWDIFMLCGDPATAGNQTPLDQCGPGLRGPISSPDNITFDRSGNVWIATDGQPGTIERNDAVFAVPVEGPDRGCPYPFLSGPRGAEICGPEFTPDNTTFFCAIQHPGEGGTPEQPVSTWPDGSPYPRPSVVAVVKTGSNGSKVIGS